MIRLAPHAVLGALLAAALTMAGPASPAHAQSATTGAPSGGTSLSTPAAPGTTPTQSHRRRRKSNTAATGTDAASTNGANTNGVSTNGASTGAATSGQTASRAAPSGQGQFSTEAAARRSCPSDTVVWANNTSKTLHLSGDRYFGKTKHGAFMCQRQATQAGYHVAGKGAVGTKKTKTTSSR